jgi:signal-transduction protein with cAMP-binding, CBS, and nucleotidyltransferase domain
MAKTLRDVMTTDLVALDAGTSAVEAARHMRDKNVGNVLITQSDELRGIVTDRDLVVRCVAEGQDAGSVRVGDLCSADLITLPQDSSIGDAVKVMTDKAVRRVPVVDGRKAVGIVSLGDLAIAQDRDSALGEISAAEPNR